MAEEGFGKKRVDEEWKLRAEEEKRKISEGSEGAPGAPADRQSVPGQGPPPSSRLSFMTLISQLGTQALAALGQFEDPRTGQRHVDLEVAKDTIDLLAILESKTRGNLEPDEDATLTDLLQQLRMAYVSLSSAAEQQPTKSPPPGEPEAPPR